MNLDETHDPALRSFVASANAPDGDFPIQNLPYAVFRTRGQNPAGRRRHRRQRFSMSRRAAAFSTAAPRTRPPPARRRTSTR